MSPSRQLCGLGVVAAIVSGLRGAHAVEPLTVTARLEWQRAAGAESCIDRAGLEKAVNRRWQREVFAAGETDLVVGGKVGRTARGEWSASIEMRRADGTSLGSRELVTRAADCSALDDSLALALGIMLDMSRQRVAEERERPEAAPAPSSAEPTTSSGAPSAPSNPAPATPSGVGGPPIAIPRETAAPRAPWHFEPVLAGEGALGALPDLAFGGRVGLATIPNGFFRVEVSASLYESEDLSRRPGAHFAAWAGELSGYPLTLAADRLRCDFGAAVRLLSLHAQGLGLDQNGVADETLVELGPRVVGVARIAGPFELIAGLGVELPLARYRFVYHDTGGGKASVHETPLVSGEMYAGVGLWL